ncbi:4Fe-4S dicluster domain-containing protein [Pseudomonas sp. PDM31]|uniref:4Fe-4S dicluster domain-containing protein n=1 Tax=Pseudomonas sp. PDM31 TaxID=2854778 RepID=UPI001C4498A1|nr:4Fe-4S dicluster domain-containing protein [Pseudomonas sp. PDM31]MBV7477610.1 4Fe-4S binding protein [Pseudomonas sp. PDM31]
MKSVNYKIEVLTENCTGCYLCEHICPTGAIVMEGPKSAALAVVNNDKCVACFRCVDVCDDDALLAPERESPLLFGTDPKSAPEADVVDLCHRAEIDPDKMVCPCSMTGAREVAAAILNGAHTMADVALATGVQSGCLMYCFAPTHRLLKTFLGVAPMPHSKNQFYDTSYVPSDISPEVASRYPQFYIAEETQTLAAEAAAQKVVPV